MKDLLTECGEFTVRIGLRPDNPAFPCYIIFKGAVLVGKQFSYPTLEDCRWLERSAQYAERSEHAKQPYGYTAAQIKRKAA